jgi:alpha-tubulin suppressor-like RCC1 family protein
MRLGSVRQGIGKHNGESLGGILRPLLVMILLVTGVAVDSSVRGAGVAEGAPVGTSLVSETLKPPTHVCGRSGDGLVEVTWAAPPDPHRTGFIVESSPAGQNTWTSTVVGAEVRSHSVATVNNAPIDVRVAARNAVSERSEWGAKCLLAWSSQSGDPVPTQVGLSWPFSAGETIADFTQDCLLSSGGDIRCSYGDVLLPDMQHGDRPVSISSTGGYWWNVSYCTVTVQGALYCWGRNDQGQLGDGSTTSRNQPVRVGGVLADARVSVVSMAEEFTCALTDDGRVACWGRNNYGRVGQRIDDATAIWQQQIFAEPVWIDISKVQGVTYSALALGSQHACAVAEEKFTVCWGFYPSGPSGDGDSLLPTRIETGPLGEEEILMISAGEGFTCALTEESNVICWGSNIYGTLGQGNTLSYSNPVVVHLSAQAKELSIGRLHTCAVLITDEVKCWGQNSEYQVGSGSATVVSTPTVVPPRILEGAEVGDLKAFQRSTCIMANGRIACWGSIDANTSYNPTVFTEPAYMFGASLDFETVVSISAGCALTDTGQLHCGFERGLNGLSRSQRVTGVLTDEVVVAHGTGAGHWCAATDSGKVACWGWNGYGQLGDGTTEQSGNPVWVTGSLLAERHVTDIAVGSDHSCALTDPGEVFCWGANYYGQLGNGSLSTQHNRPVAVNGGALAGSVVESFSAGGYHSCAVTQAHRVACWGGNWNQQVRQVYSEIERMPVHVESGALLGQSIVQVQGGSSHTCALNATGRVICWGYGGSGALGNGEQWSYGNPSFALGGPLATTTVVALSGEGGSQTCAISDVSEVICWGGGAYNGDGLRLPVTIDQARLWKGTVQSVVAGPVAFSQWGGTVAAGDPPTRPVTSVAFVVGKAITAGWSPPVWSGASSIDGYIIEASSDLGVTWPLRFETDGSARSVTFDVPRDDYWLVRVTARNSAATSEASHADQEVLVRTETRVVRSNVSVTFSTESGEKVRGTQVSWRTTDNALSSVTPVVTSVDGVALLPVVATGPVVFSLSGGNLGDGETTLQGSTLTVVIPITGAVPTIMMPDQPPVITRTINVRMPDGQPVPGATLSVHGGIGGSATTARASSTRSFAAHWGYPGWSDYWWWEEDLPTTGPNGTAVLTGFARPSVGNDVTAAYSDGTLRQQASGPLLLPELTLVFEQMPFVAVSSALPDGEFSVRSGEAVEIAVEAIDGNGSSLEGATLSFAEVIQGQPLSIGAMGFSLGLASTCLPKTSGVTDTNGQTTLRLCPQSSGTWRVVGSNLVPSMPFKVRVEPTLGNDSPSTGTNPGGGSTGGGAPSGGGGGGGGGGSSGEPVSATVPRPVSATTPVTVGFTVPAGRLELKLSGLTAAAEATVTVIEAPEASGVTLMPTAFDIDVVTSGRLGQAELCVPIDTREVAAAEVDPQRLSLYHFNPGPVDITTRVTATQVCGVTSSFSPFALGVPASGRIAGANRYDTAARLVGLAFPGTADLVLVATGANFPDALAASAAAAKADAPLLLVNPTAIPAATRAQLTRLKPKRIVIVGGTAAVSAAVEQELSRFGTVERVAGTNRFETAARLAIRFFDSSTTDAYLVNGDNFPDALAAGCGIFVYGTTGVVNSGGFSAGSHIGGVA